MHHVISALITELELVVGGITATVPSDAAFAAAHSNWTFPAISRDDLIDKVDSVRVRLQEDAPEDLGIHQLRLEKFIENLQFLRTHTVPQIWGNAAAACPSFFLTLDALELALKPLFRVDEADQALASRATSNQLRSIEAQVLRLASRSHSLDAMVTKIESAHDAAEQLPENLASLSDARTQMQLLLSEAERDRGLAFSARESAESMRGLMEEISKEAASVLEKAEQAYSANTSQGLAAAFAERSESLGISMYLWVCGLIASLALGSFLGKAQLQNLAELIKTPGASDAALALNLLLSVISVGAPIWFAWLATKQVGQRFRLAEDYAFKASVSKAYEGYRKETTRVDPALGALLLKSALMRLEEQPLRFVEPASYGSPWHELVSSNTVKEALQSVPGFAERVRELAKGLIEKPSGSK